VNIDKAINWMLNNWNKDEGIIVTSKQRISYPEVTGYYIPTLLNLGYREEAYNAGRWLALIQKKDGSIPLGLNRFTFDTAMVLSGWIELGGYEEQRKKACEFLMSQIKEDGSISTEFHANGVPEKINLWVAKLLYKERYVEHARKIWNYYAHNSKTVDFDCLSHFHCYVLDACYDTPLHDISLRGIKFLYDIQRSDGSIPAYRNVNWTCYTGVAQAAILFYRMGLDAKKQMEYLAKVMSPDGGFYGSSGAYFGDQKVSWAVKFYIDAYLEMIKFEINKQCNRFSDTVERRDSRMLTILNTFNSKDIKVLDVGCGKGRYAKHLIEAGIKVYGIDISSKLLEFCDKNIIKKEGNATRIPYPDNTFDGIYCIEVLEHTSYVIDNAIKEMCRVLKSGGKLVVIDKSNKLGGGKEGWESWFDLGIVRKIFERYFINIEAYQLSNIFLVWKGVKK